MPELCKHPLTSAFPDRFTNYQSSWRVIQSENSNLPASIAWRIGIHRAVLRVQLVQLFSFPKRWKGTAYSPHFIDTHVFIPQLVAFFDF